MLSDEHEKMPHFGGFSVFDPKKTPRNLLWIIMSFDYLSYKSNLLILGHPHICDRGGRGSWASTLYSVHRCIYIYYSEFYNTLKFYLNTHFLCTYRESNKAVSHNDAFTTIWWYRDARIEFHYLHQTCRIAGQHCEHCGFFHNYTTIFSKWRWMNDI